MKRNRVMFIVLIFALLALLTACQTSQPSPIMPSATVPSATTASPTTSTPIPPPVVVLPTTTNPQPTLTSTPAPGSPTLVPPPTPVPTPIQTTRPPPPPTTTPTPAPITKITIDLIAQNFAFDMKVITVPAGAQVTVNFANKDSVPHNLAIYTDASATAAIFKGDIANGSGTITYTFSAPAAPGTYFFRCDIHPSMTGDFTVTPK
ncbi:MAG: cupredoxin domain-containing protein [Dehalococcoidales bacterium]|nr:cupredoxin domain-containing protein [Dehalococcoidales bacterium]